MEETEYFRTGKQYALDGKLRDQCPYSDVYKRDEFIRGYIRGTLELKKQKKENV